jgi:aminocarboxymuconate-semialdehyde decarboxylase
VAIDLHSHWTPRGLMKASAEGKEWYGWRLLYDKAGKEYSSFRDRIVPRAFSKSSLEDPMARAAIRKSEGVDLEALLISGAMFNYHLDEETLCAFCREVNDEAAEVQAAYPDRFRGIAVLPMPYAKRAMEEIDRAAGKLGLRTVSTASNVRDLNLDEPAVLPILEHAAKSGVSIQVHPTIFDKAADRRLPRYQFWNSFGAPLESSIAAMSVAYSGLLDRHPDTRIMFTQGGGWIHYGVGRVNLRFEQNKGNAADQPIEKTPADYLRMMYFDCLVHDVDSLALLVKRAGIDQIVTGTDFPAGGGIIGGTVKWISENPNLSASDKEKILTLNARRFLGIN